MNVYGSFLINQLDLLIQTKTLGEAYAVLNELSQSLKLSHLEVRPLAVEAVLWVSFDKNQEEAAKEILLKHKILKHHLIEDLSVMVRNAYYGLSSAVLKKELLILEHQNLGLIFDCTNEVIKCGAEVIEISCPYNSHGVARAFITSEKELKSYLQSLGSISGLNISLIENPSNQIKELF